MRPTRIAFLAVALSFGLGSLASAARADDAGLQKALKAYEKRLTADVSYLAGFTRPSKSAVAGTLHRLSKIAKDLGGATHAARTHQASTSSGAKGRSEVISALGDASTAVRDAQASAKAVRGDKLAKAKHEGKLERRAINRAIPLFEDGGSRLHLF